MASSSSPSSFSDDEDNYSQLMSRPTPPSSPTPPSRKRTADEAGLDGNDDVDLRPADTLLSHPNGSYFRSISAYATAKRLRPKQIAEVEGFLGDSTPVKLAKLFVTMKANENLLAKFQAAKPKFEINSALRANLVQAVNAMLCSSQITQYRGLVAKGDVQFLLSRHRWGNFVVGTKHDQHSMAVVSKFIGDTFTQSRSTIKKEIVKSLEVPVPTASSKSKKPHVPAL
ncbi:hypothetical protein K438DRAFT_1780525 [Mycena galopus ATCC 62051]|nr:hypothetical protein K438DRAFT_1780525 [Mycena galopus ATCC 62051]